MFERYALLARAGLRGATHGGCKARARVLDSHSSGGWIDWRLSGYEEGITNSPLPISNYTATIRVREQADGSQCVVEWSSEFEPSGAPEGDAVSAIQGIYQAGLENLKKMYGL